MRKRALGWIYGLLCAVAPCISVDAVSGSVDLEYGTRLDNFDWNIAASGGTPNVLSELEWTDLEIQLVGIRAQLTPDYFVFRLEADYGWILDGDVQDSDYGADNRQVEFSRSYSRAKGDYVADISVSAGCRLPVPRTRIQLLPLAGYSYHIQNLGITDGEQVLGGVLGPINGLDSHYDAQWYGPWIGLGTLGCIAGVEVDATYEWHWSSYRAEGFWNLRPDLLDDFEHSATGLGQKISVGAKKRMNGMVVGARLSYVDWEATDGRDRTFLVVNTPSGPVDSFIDAPLNEVHWRGVAATFTASWAF